MYTAAEIETIVKVVIERLRDTAALPHNESFGVAKDNRQKQSTAATDSSRGRLLVTQRVITLELLAGRLEGITVLQVPQNAIVTPAVIDELKDRGVQLARSSQRGARVHRSVPSDLLMVAPISWRSTLGDRVEFTAGSQNCAADVRRIAVHVNSGGTKALWVTETPFAAARAAAENTAVHAVQLLSAQDLSRAVREAEPNTLILDQLSWDGSQVLELIADWSGGAD